MRKSNDAIFYFILAFCLGISILCVELLSHIREQAPANDTEAKRNGNVLEYRDDKAVFVYVDPDTGVNYLVYYGSNGRDGITERLNPDGTPFVSY